MIVEYALLSKPRREVLHGSAMVYESIQIFLMILLCQGDANTDLITRCVI